MVPVAGTVTIDGKSLKRGLVTVNVKDSRPAYGKIGADGKFQLMTKVEGDGCIVGDHAVTVLSREPLGPDTMRHLIPEKYADETTSGLKMKIDGPIENYEIKLTWEGSGKKEPYVIGEIPKTKVKEK
jgi:hypothetical protein